MIQQIKSRLILGYTILLVLLISMAMYLTSNLSQSNKRFKNTIDVTVKNINTSNELMIAVLQGSRYEKNIILETDISHKIKYHELINKQLEIIDQKTKELELIINPEGKALLNEFKIAWSGYMIDLDQIIKLAMQNDNQGAFSISISKGLKVRDIAIKQLESICSINMQQLDKSKIKNEESYNSARMLLLILIVLSILITILLSYTIIHSITKRIKYISKEVEIIASRNSTQLPENTINDELKPILNSLENVIHSFHEITENAEKVSSGDYSNDIIPKSKNDVLGIALNKMTHSLRDSSEINEQRLWLSKGQISLNEKLTGDQAIEELANNAIHFLCTYLNAQIGGLYLVNESNSEIKLLGRYAFTSNTKTNSTISINEGLIGEAAHSKKVFNLKSKEEISLRIESSIMSSTPKQVVISPFINEDKTIGVIEIGWLNEITEDKLEFIKQSMKSIAIQFESARSRKRIQELLHETQIQTEEMQLQQEELRQTNEELEDKSHNLKQQQEELQMTNEELEQQTQSLELKNKEVELSRYDIEQKTKQLEISSKYKSEFLANMSHELRTPLNSLLILSKELANNKKGNLDSLQVECAEIVYKSGHDLLVLINEVLDLSKIEAGKMILVIDQIEIKEFIHDSLRNFKHLAHEKGIEIDSEFGEHIPEFIWSDIQRLNQIIKNLLSNAIKFTNKGSIRINIKLINETTISIGIRDTGIGIPINKQEAIFEAFQQADGGTSRKYGGTGLGLSISRELAKLLGGKIEIKSEENIGSEFSLVIPIKLNIEPENSIESNEFKYTEENVDITKFKIDKNQSKINSNLPSVLIIVEDKQCALLLQNLVNNKGFKYNIALNGDEGLKLAILFKPVAIILDMNLPENQSGKFLNNLKENLDIKSIPLHQISSHNMAKKVHHDGRITYLLKPAEKLELEKEFNQIEANSKRKIKTVLIVEDNENSRKAMKILIGNDEVNCLEASNGQEAIVHLKEQHVDCILLDLGLPDISGIDLIKQINKIEGMNVPPIIVYTGRELNKSENEELEKYTQSIIIKGVKSEERLLDETSLFLHKTKINLPMNTIEKVFNKEHIFEGKKILLAEDDMRNVFALKLVLNEHGMEVIRAENGREALELLEIHPNIDMILMDIMMPEMDGFETMKRIRSSSKYKNLPMLALTAKAMKDDKQKCIDSGANDYVTKPIDIEQLLSLMRVWLSK